MAITPEREIPASLIIVSANVTSRFKAKARAEHFRTRWRLAKMPNARCVSPLVARYVCRGFRFVHKESVCGFRRVPYASIALVSTRCFHFQIFLLVCRGFLTLCL